MIRAVLYSSRTGHSKEYADMLGSALGLEVLEVGEDLERLSATDEVIYVTWLRGGVPVCLKKVLSRVKIVCVCAVGFISDNDEIRNILKKRYKLSDVPAFFLPGGCNYEKLRGIDRFVMKLMKNSIGSEMRESNDITANDKAFFQILSDGGSFVDEEYIKPVIEKFKNKY